MDTKHLEELGYENILAYDESGQYVYTATIYGLCVLGCEDTLSFLAQALQQNREETNLWKGLVSKGVRK